MLDNDCFEEDFDETEDETPITLQNIYISRSEIEHLISTGVIDLEFIENDCDVCFESYILQPRLILKD